MLIITLILSVLLLTSCKGKETISDSKKFASEYTQVQEYNVFTYRSEDEIIKILEHGTGIVYLGFPECPWCQAYVKYLNETAKRCQYRKNFIILIYLKIERIIQKSIKKLYLYLEIIFREMMRVI